MLKNHFHHKNLEEMMLSQNRNCIRNFQNGVFSCPLRGTEGHKIERRYHSSQWCCILEQIFWEDTECDPSLKEGEDTLSSMKVLG